MPCVETPHGQLAARSRLHHARAVRSPGVNGAYEERARGGVCRGKQKSEFSKIRFHHTNFLPRIEFCALNAQRTALRRRLSDSTLVSKRSATKARHRGVVCGDKKYSRAGCGGFVPAHMKPAVIRRDVCNFLSQATGDGESAASAPRGRALRRRALPRAVQKFCPPAYRFAQNPRLSGCRHPPPARRKLRAFHERAREARKARRCKTILVAYTKSAAAAERARSKIPICVIQFIEENVLSFSYENRKGRRIHNDVTLRTLRDARGARLHGFAREPFRHSPFLKSCNLSVIP